MAATEAWIRAGYNVTREVARVNASESLSKPHIKSLVEDLRAKNSRESIASADELKRFYTAIIRTPIGELSPSSPLVVEWSTNRVSGGTRGKLRRGQADSGNEVVEPQVIRTRVRGHDKLRAAELLAKLCGYNAPDRLEIETGPKTLDAIRERAEHVRAVLARNVTFRTGGTALPAPTANGSNGHQNGSNGNGHHPSNGALHQNGRQIVEVEAVPAPAPKPAGLSRWTP